MQAHRQIGRLTFQRLVQHPGINARQRIRIVAALAYLLTLGIGAQVGPHGIVQLQIAAAGVIKRADRVAPGGGQIVEVVAKIRVNGGINIFPPAAEVQHARAGNGHLRLRVAADAFQIAEVLQHRVVAKRQLAGDANAVRFGLHAVKLDPLLGIVTFNALQAIEEIEMPPCAPKLTVGDHMQAAVALLLNQMTDRVILNLA